MKKYFNRIMISQILSSLLFILLGIFLLIKPDLINTIIGYFIGGIILVSGVVSIVKYFVNQNVISFFNFELIFGLLSFLLGMLIILNPMTATSVLTVFLGVWVIVSGAIKTQYALEIRRYKEPYWALTFAIAILTLFAGLLVVFNPFSSTLLLTEMIGMFIIIYGVLDIVEALILKRNVKNIEKIIKKMKK